MVPNESQYFLKTNLFSKNQSIEIMKQINFMRRYLIPKHFLNILLFSCYISVYKQDYLTQSNIIIIHNFHSISYFTAILKHVTFQHLYCVSVL